MNVSGGNVITAAVSVYVGNRLRATEAPVIVAGGQGKLSVEEAGMDDGVPVCHGEYVPSKGSCAAPKARHFP